MKKKNKENTEKNKDNVIKFLVFPNKSSSNFIKEVKNQFKNSQVFSYPIDKRKSENDIIELNDNIPPNTWENELEQYLLKGMPPQLNEVVFFHEKSKTLILNELLLYFQNVDNKPFFSKFMYRLLGVYNQCRTPWDVIMTWDKAKIDLDIRRILKWDFDTIILGHGDMVLNNGKQIFKDAFKFVL